MATALGGSNINVNAIAPGAIMTETMKVLVKGDNGKTSDRESTAKKGD